MSNARELLQAVRNRFPLREVVAGHDVWGVRDTRVAYGNLDGALPLVLLHGPLGSGDMFFRLVDALSPRRRVLAMNLPALPSAALLAYSLATLLRNLELPRVDLLGTSLGGYVAQRFAIGHPERVRRLVLSNSYYDAGPIQRRWPSPADVECQSAAQVLASTRAQVQRRPEHTPELADLKWLLLEQIGHAQSAQCVKALRLAMLTATVLPPLPLAPECVALIDSPDDALVPPLLREQMTLRFAGSRHFSIPGGGYQPGHLQPAAYLEAVRAALED
ncbi:MAG: alpha/beta hydrolase [Pseudomonadota bacterium]